MCAYSFSFFVFSFRLSLRACVCVCFCVRLRLWGMISLLAGARQSGGLFRALYRFSPTVNPSDFNNRWLWILEYIIGAYGFVWGFRHFRCSLSPRSRLGFGGKLGEGSLVSI